MEYTRYVIGKRIDELLTTSDKKQKELATYLGVKDNVISYFVNGVRMPNVEQIIKIADFFETTTDYILGKGNTPSLDRDKQFVCKYTGLSDNAIKVLREEIPEAGDVFSGYYCYFDGMDSVNSIITNSNFIDIVSKLGVSMRLHHKMSTNGLTFLEKQNAEACYYGTRYQLDCLFNKIIDDIIKKAVEDEKKV